MAYTDEEIKNYIQSIIGNTNMSEADKASTINGAMSQYGINPLDINRATGYDFQSIYDYRAQDPVFAKSAGYIPSTVASSTPQPQTTANSVTIGKNTFGADELKSWYGSTGGDPYQIAQKASEFGANADQIAQAMRIGSGGAYTGTADNVSKYVTENMAPYEFNSTGAFSKQTTDTPTSGAITPYRENSSYVNPGAYQHLSNGDYDALQKAIYDSSTAGLARQEELARANSDQGMANRGIWSSGIAQRSQNDITGQLGAAYQSAGANAANTRYNLQAQDLSNSNSYNANAAAANNAYNTANTQNYNNWTANATSLANQYDLGKTSNDNQRQSIDDSYALSRAGLLNDANAQASNSQWQAQWTPANFLSGMWNGTGGTISSGSSGGGWNFMI